MTQQVLFDPTSGAIVQWQDTDQFSYPAPAANLDVLAVTSAQWAERATFASVVSGQLETTPAVFTNGDTVAGIAAAQSKILFAAYQQAIAQTVPFKTAGGVSKSFQADPQSIANLQAMLAAFTPANAVPSGFYWIAADNTQVPVTLADLQGLAAAMAAQGWAAFQHLQTKKSAVAAATTVAAVQAIAWA